VEDNGHQHQEDRRYSLSRSIDVDALAEAISKAMQMSTTMSNMPKLPSYSGENDAMEFTAFLECFEEIMELNGWHTLPSAHKASLLRSSMTRRASESFSGLTHHVKRDFDLAKTELTRIFVNQAKVVLYQNEFDNKLQTTDESLQDLLTALRRLARRAYPDVAKDPKALDSFVHRRFVDAIRDVKLRDQVRLFRRDTVDLTLVEAYRLQAAFAQRQEKNQVNTPQISGVNMQYAPRYGQNFRHPAPVGNFFHRTDHR
jgi:hypothetical protein